MATLISYCGGPENFTERLEALFDEDLFNPGNEPSFNSPYLYNYVGRQDLSVKRSRSVAKEHYSADPDGLPGNSDAGAMESWIIWNMIGLYPVTGQPVFLVGSPWFEDLRIDLGAGRTLEITSEGGSDDAYQVQSLELNGQPWNKAWISWEDVFAEGGSLHFVLGPDAKNWATGSLPPTPASENGFASEYFDGVETASAVAEKM